MARSSTKLNISPSRSRRRQIDDNGLNRRLDVLRSPFRNPILSEWSATQSQADRGMPCITAMSFNGFPRSGPVLDRGSLSQAASYKRPWWRSFSGKITRNSGANPEALVSDCGRCPKPYLR